jgi:2-oxoglutarate ferredoxin oxidoreductase subunit beta
MDMTYIVMDNEVYGMTKGQASPTTLPDWCNSKMTPHGTGISSFNPAAIALAAGAGFIARGYSGEPSELTRLLVKAIEHPGFAFVQVLSACVTYRPDQKRWKEEVHPLERELPTDNPVKAAQIIQADDGKATGIIYAKSFPVWQPQNHADSDLRTIEKEFLL